MSNFEITTLTPPKAHVGKNPPPAERKAREELEAALAGAIERLRASSRHGRAERLELLRKRIKSGDYRVDPGTLADKIIARELR